MIRSWNPWVAIMFAGAPFFLAIGNLIFSLYLNRRYLDAMVDALRNSRHIILWGSILQCQGLKGRLMLLAKISGVVMWPGMFIRAGEIDSDDIKNFPPHFKRLLKIKLVILTTAMAWLILIYILLKIE
ncbi:hypothetical protein [Pseudomonas sp. R5(2019)]|uniref:hypothetical protein n=1 Tax=Pseudomonas sp. R5(2019) TaxID=2697566 RepID=UPI001413610D|nr:hypothetical protein [Pseudomonas sp. R5(2019)]NBA97151.1 hypothetical protein [Pseudomonas sp. R5(2019)]